MQTPRKAPLYCKFPPCEGKYKVLVLNIIDGDTVECAFLVPCSFRISGCNAPEHDSEDGKKSIEFLNSVIKPLSLVDCELYGHEKYGRLLADFFINSESVSKAMVDKGFAKKWDGKGKKPI